MTVLVTGAPGWLGTELVKQLDHQDAEIHCLTLKGVDTSPLDPFDVEIHAGDIRSPESLESAFDNNITTVYHCAGIIHPSSLFGADQFYSINADGTRNMLESAIQNDVDHFIYVSSNAAQGFNSSPNELMTEEMPCRPESDYGRSKYIAEQHVRRYHQEHGLDYTIVRPCWYYGPRQPERMNRLMGMILDGHPIIFGDGTNLRSMTYIPSLVEALLTVRANSTVAMEETYWIADERPYPTDYVYRTIADCLGVVEDLKPIYIPTPISRIMELLDGVLGRIGVYEQNIHVAGEMSRTIACDPSKAVRELDYDPPNDLYGGIQESVDWAREQNQI